MSVFKVTFPTSDERAVNGFSSKTLEAANAERAVIRAMQGWEMPIRAGCNDCPTEIELISGSRIKATFWFQARRYVREYDISVETV